MKTLAPLSVCTSCRQQGIRAVKHCWNKIQTQDELYNGCRMIVVVVVVSSQITFFGLRLMPESLVLAKDEATQCLLIAGICWC